MQPAENISIAETFDSALEAAVPAGPQTRHLLVRKLADLVVLSQSKLNNNERDFVADLLIRALDNVELSTREEVAARISGFADVPIQLQRFLMTDDIVVARPLLENLTTIPESVLLEVSQLGTEYRRLIADRDHLPPGVVDYILFCGETELIVRILKRDNLEISSVAMDSLVARSEAEELIKSLVIRRPELRLEHGLRMFWWLKSPLRKIVLARFAVDRSIIQEAMHSLFVEIFTNENPDRHVKAILKLIDRRHRPRGRNGETVTMDIVERTLKLARLNPTEEFCHAVGLLAGVTTETAGQALRDLGGEGFAILCKSIGLSRTAFAALFEDDGNVDETAPQYSAEKVEELIGIFDSIARDYSRTILRYWDWKQDLYKKPADRHTPAVRETSEADDGYFGAI